MALDRFRQFRGVRTRSSRFDGDTKDGVGQALRQSIPFADAPDEGDQRALEMIDLLRQIEARPDAPDAAAD